MTSRSHYNDENLLVQSSHTGKYVPTVFILIHKCRTWGALNKIDREESEYTIEHTQI